MEVQHLTDEEVFIELEIRSMLKSPNKMLTEDLKTALKERWRTESGNPMNMPLKAHTNAKQNPRREAKDCAMKMATVKQQLLKLDTSRDAELEILDAAVTKLLHIHGRLVRISGSLVLQKHIQDFFTAIQCLFEIINNLRNGKETLEENIEKITAIPIPYVNSAAEDETGTEYRPIKATPRIDIPSAPIASGSAIVVTTDGDDEVGFLERSNKPRR